MNQEVLSQPVALVSPTERRGSLSSYLPTFLAIGGSLALVAARLNFGGERFISDGALMMLARVQQDITALLTPPRLQ